MLILSIDQIVTKMEEKRDYSLCISIHSLITYSCKALMNIKLLTSVIVLICLEYIIQTNIQNSL